MPRSLDRRIQVLVPIEDERLQAELGGVVDALLGDTGPSWDLDADGVWHRTQSRGSRRPVSEQQTLMTRASK